MNFFKSFIHSFTDETNLVIHNVGVILFLVGIPVAYPVLYSLIYNQELVRDVPVVVVDHDATAYSRQLIRDFDATPEAKVIGHAADLSEARRAMDSHECYGILEIPQDFQRKIGRDEKAAAVLYADMSLLIRYKALLTAATNVSQAIGSELKEGDGSVISTLVPYDPMPVKPVYLGDITGGYASFLMPGILVLIAQQCVIMGICMAGGARRENRRYGELKGPLAATVFGRAFCYLVMMIIPMLLLLYYAPLVFCFPMAGNEFEIYCFMLPLLISSIMLGFCLQGLMWESESVFMIWAGVSMALLFLSGFTWPRFAMPLAWRLVADVIPATFGILGYIRMSSNGADLAQVSGEYLALWIQAIVYTAFALWVQSRLRRKSAAK